MARARARTWARWALALSLLLLALPARAARWQPQPVAQDEEEEEAPGEGLAGRGESAVLAAGPEYQDGREQSSVETVQVLQDILRELKAIVGGMKRLGQSSAVSRRSPGDSGTEPGTKPGTRPSTEPGEAEPDAPVLGRADSNAVDASSFQTYCIEGIVAILGSMLLGMVLCCVIHVWRKRRR